MKTLGGMCRICLAEKEELTDIFTFSNRLGVQIVSAISMCAPVHIMKHDGLPKTICNPCHIRLKVAYEFQTQALESENTLNVYLKNLQANSVNFKDPNAVCYDKSKGQESLEVCNVKIETFDQESHQTLDEQPVCNNIQVEENDNIDSKCSANLLESHKRTYFDDTIITQVKEFYKCDLRTPSGEKLYQCEVCNKNIKLSVINKKMHSGEKYPRCEDCDKRTNLEVRRKFHERSYRCDFCGNSFTQLQRLKAHRKIHSDEKNSLSVFENNEIKSEIVTIDEDDQGSQEEQEAFTEDPLYHLEENQQTCFDDYSTGHKTIGEEFYYRNKILEEANKLYQNADSLLEKNRNTVEKITSKNPHSDDKPYRCKVCGKGFTQLSNLKAHRRIHSGETYQCDSCDKCFTKLHVLMIHRKTHSGEKPYECDVCHKCFGRPDILKTHKRTHSDEKPYKCDECHKGFKYLQVLTAHKRTHAEVKPYQCNVCSKYFTQLDSLITHNRTHSGEKPYQCDICSKCFTRSDIMRTHRRTHSGEKPYQCDVCNKCFTRMSILKMHRVKHNKEKVN